MIDPRDFGRVEAEVKALDSKMVSLDEKVEKLDAKVEKLVELAQKGRGGIHTLWFIGAMVTGFLGWLGADRVLDK